VQTSLPRGRRSQPQQVPQAAPKPIGTGYFGTQSYASSSRDPHADGLPKWTIFVAIVDSPSSRQGLRITSRVAQERLHGCKRLNRTIGPTILVFQKTNRLDMPWMDCKERMR